MIQTAQPQTLAMISVPWQEYITPMSPAESLSRGTVFSNLAQTYTPTVLPQSVTPAQMPPMMQGMNAMSNMNTMQMSN
ncbi:MAG: spore coat associated protein CotJA, partial [Alphaproteobacteria bacterium]|nr:spore coat associated protein CotJA [Alphaproteobacteria bacterium]